MIGCVTPVGGHQHGVVRRRLPEAARARGKPAAAIVQLDRQHFFERRAEQPLVRKRTAAQHQQAAAALADEVRHQRELRAREEVAFDVGDEDASYAYSASRVAGNPETSDVGPAAAGLHEERVLAGFVLALADDGVDLEARIGGQRARQETVLVAGRALQREDAAARGRPG